MKVLGRFCHIPLSFVRIFMLGIINWSISISLGFAQGPNENDTLTADQLFLEADKAVGQVFDTTALGFNTNDEAFNKRTSSSPMRFGIKYELACKVAKPAEIMINRLAFRLEYSKSLSDHFSLQIDTKVFTFLKGDHRAGKSTFWINDASEEAALSFGGRTRDAYVQTSFDKTSVKAGIQTLAWGESDFAIVTDEMSPLDYREPLNLNIDELRLGQLMLTVDQYSSFGKWSGFFIPFPRFNEHPKKGTGYYYDPFDGSVGYEMDGNDKNSFEYGVRWKKTFGKSDVSIIAASLIDNRYALRMVTPGIITQSKLRYTLAGVTFNRAINSFLVRGEVAMKMPKAYNDASFGIMKKNALDATLGVDYYLNSTLTLSMEAVNYHIINWNDKIQGVPQNNYLILLILSKQLKNNDLSLNCVTMYNGPYSNFFNLLTTSYKYNDHITMYFDILIPITDNVNSGLYRYRDQKQVIFKLQYQF